MDSERVVDALVEVRQTGDTPSAAARAPSGATRRRRMRGQAMVEFALVAPFFFALLFGVIEFSLIGSSISSFNFAAQDGARIGSFEGRTTPTVDQDICNEIQSRVQGVVFAQTQQVEVFKSDVTGAGPGAADNVYTDLTNCTLTTPPYPVDSRDDTLADADYLGVRITYLYTYLTGFVAGGNSTLQLTATSVQRIEPQDFQGRVRPAPAPSIASVRLAAAPAQPQGATAGAVSSGALAPSEAALPADESRRWHGNGRSV
jgi:Flp pilus assembly protein TadG